MNGAARLVANVKVACEGGCGALVLPDDRFCEECQQINHDLELRRAFRENVIAEYKRAGVGVIPWPERVESGARINTGVADYGQKVYAEDAGVGSILAGMSARDLVCMALLAIGSVFALTVAGAVAWFGVRAIVAKLLGVATQ